MLSTKVIFEYRKEFPNDRCFFCESGTGVFIDSKSEEKTFISPFDETDEIFIDRIKRSKEVGRNLFYEEWNTFEYNPDYVY